MNRISSILKYTLIVISITAFLCAEYKVIKVSYGIKMNSDGKTVVVKKGSKLKGSEVVKIPANAVLSCKSSSGKQLTITGVYTGTIDSYAKKSKAVGTGTMTKLSKLLNNNYKKMHQATMVAGVRGSKKEPTQNMLWAGDEDTGGGAVTDKDKAAAEGSEIIKLYDEGDFTKAHPKANAYLTTYKSSETANGVSFARTWAYHNSGANQEAITSARFHLKNYSQQSEAAALIAIENCLILGKDSGEFHSYVKSAEGKEILAAITK